MVVFVACWICGKFWIFFGNGVDGFSMADLLGVDRPHCSDIDEFVEILRLWI